MVYVMISPNYDVNTCQCTDMQYIKKGKVPENRRKKIFSPVHTVEIWNLALQEEKLQIRVLPRKNSFTEAKPEPPAPYDPETADSERQGPYFLVLNGGLEICWTLQRQV